MKKQFRLFDIYQYASMEIPSQIIGIKNYYASKVPGNIVINIQFENGTFMTQYCSTVGQLKLFIKNVNKHLNNCRKPGRRKYSK